MTVPVVTGARAQACCGEGGGAPGAACDYLPYCFNVTEDDPDTVIAALNPQAYWKMDDAAGLPQDSSGNGNHADAIVGATYSQAALSAKVGNSIALGDDTGSIHFPDVLSIATNMSDCDEEFTLIGLVMFTTSAQPNGNGVVWMAHSYASTAVDWGFYFNDDVRTMWQIISQTVVGGAVAPRFCPALNQPIVFAVRAKILAAGLGLQDVWVNGVIVETALRVNDNNAETPGFSIGVGAGFFGSPGMRVSNWAAWSSALTDDEVFSVCASLMDAPMMAAAAVLYP